MSDYHITSQGSLASAFTVRLHSLPHFVPTPDPGSFSVGWEDGERELQILWKCEKVLVLLLRGKPPKTLQHHWEGRLILIHGPIQRGAKGDSGSRWLSSSG